MGRSQNLLIGLGVHDRVGYRSVGVAQRAEPAKLRPGQGSSIIPRFRKEPSPQSTPAYGARIFLTLYDDHHLHHLHFHYRENNNHIQSP
jgi:hypothetical protein